MGDRSLKTGLNGRAALTVAAILLLCAGCPNPMRQTLELVVRDYSTPTVTVSSPDGMGIAKTTAIVITFSESMDMSSLTLAGNMQVESDGGVWSSGANPSDTLTISPRSTWTLGSGRVLVVNCRDLDGYAVPSITLNYGVLDGVVYVHAAKGNDANPGTADMPKKTIPAAVDLAALYYDAAEVHVAGGVYNVSYQAGTHVVMKESISLYGGYDPNDWDTPRNPAVYISKIKDTSNQASSGKKNRAVDCGQNLTSPTVIDGFTIEGGSDPSTTSVNCAIDCNTSAPTIRNCVVNGGLGDSSVGIRVLNAAPDIQGCTIGGGIGLSQSTGIYLADATATVTGNTIDGGQGSVAYGVLCDGGSPTLEANTIQGAQTGMQPDKTTALCLMASNATVIRNFIDGGFGYKYVIGVDIAGGTQAFVRNNVIYGGNGPPGVESSSYGVFIDNNPVLLQNNTISSGDPGSSSPLSMAVGIIISNCAPTIENNIVFTSGGNDRVGVWEFSGGRPVAFNNNDVYNSASALYVTNDFTLHANFTTINGYSWAEANVSADPLFVDLDGADDNIRTMADNDWHLTGSSPSSVRTGGLNLGASFTVDKDNVSRTPPWSIGAYEQN